ncbi:hypothetical protein BDM02DRAFT_3132921, partial [Thelephora ganbajun]
MSAFTNRPFSRLWHGKSRSDTHPHSSDFVGDAAPPFAELASGLDPIPAAEELARIRYYNSKMAIRDTEFVDMDLTHGRRRLICAGRLFRTDSTFEWKGMYELFVLLFDNYRTRPSYRPHRWTAKLSALLCSCGNPDHWD